MVLRATCACSSMMMTHISNCVSYHRLFYVHHLQNGLLTFQERQTKGVFSRFNGSAYGDGVYTANNAHAHNRYGEVGLLVARLKGNCSLVTNHHRYSSAHGAVGSDSDTGIAFAGSYSEMVILRSSYQCVPLVCFDRSVVTGAHSNEGQKMIHNYHCLLQRIVDNVFNDGQPTEVESVPASQSSSVFAYPSPISSLQRQYQTFPRPTTTQVNSTSYHSETFEYVAPSTLDLSAKTPQGKMPSGTMRVSRYKQDVLECGGGKHGTIVIVYSIPRGVQKLYHGNPGQEYSSTQRAAYLPDNTEGQELVQRLIYAFCCGLTFLVDTVDQKNIVDWSCIPHKKRYTDFPDRVYMQCCNDVLDEYKVPSASECNSDTYRIANKGVVENATKLPPS